MMLANTYFHFPWPFCRSLPVFLNNSSGSRKPTRCLSFSMRSSGSPLAMIRSRLHRRAQSRITVFRLTGEGGNVRGVAAMMLQFVEVNEAANE